MRRLAPGILTATQSGEIAERVTALSSEMATLTAFFTDRARRRGLPAPPLSDPKAMARTLESFLIAIPLMIVIGNAIEAAMPPTVPRWHDDPDRILGQGGAPTTG